jgi:choline dehydrogenase-like flavoprotein
MIVDAAELAPGTILDTDLCIVGAGTAGVTLAREFIGAPCRVCVLESGGREPEPDTQSLYAGENIGFPYYPLDDARARVWGGSSTRWHIPIGDGRVGPRIRPLDDIDFERRDWVPHSGWPFDRQHLQPYYDRAEAVCAIEPTTYDVSGWDDPAERPRLPLGDGPVDTVIYKFVWGQLFARHYPEQVAAAANITTCLHANVLEIETNPQASHVEQLRVATLGGKELRVRARLVVLALGGIETPRLMLLSRRHQATGVGNQHDLVGRFFMEHLHLWSGMLVIDQTRPLENLTLYRDVQQVRGVPILGKLALRPEILRRERLLNQNIQLMATCRPDPFKYRTVRAEPIEALKALMTRDGLSHGASHAGTVVRGLDDLATVAFRKMRAAAVGTPVRPVLVFANMAEQVPCAQSRVMLGSDRDAFGQPRVKLDWRITAQDMQSVIRTQELVGQALERAGLGRFHCELLDDTPPAATHGGYHHIGTTRMHDDPKQGVVDADCRVHGADNLYVAGSSVFPTGGYANPVLTTVALALRLGDCLKQKLAIPA